jgi:hypothetical protein
MNDENLRVQYERFRESAGGYDDIGHQLGRLQLRILARTEAEGTCWGTDETGATFAEGYVPDVAETMSSLADVAGRVNDAAANIRTNADAYLATEQRFQDRLSGIQGGPPWG